MEKLQDRQKAAACILKPTYWARAQPVTEGPSFSSLIPHRHPCSFRSSCWCPRVSFSVLGYTQFLQRSWYFCSFSLWTFPMIFFYLQSHSRAAEHDCISASTSCKNRKSQHSTRPSMTASPHLLPSLVLWGMDRKVFPSSHCIPGFILQSLQRIIHGTSLSLITTRLNL